MLKLIENGNLIINFAASHCCDFNFYGYSNVLLREKKPFYYIRYHISWTSVLTVRGY